MRMTRIFLLVAVVLGLAGCGTADDGGKAGVGFGSDEIRPSPCACMEIKGPYRTPVTS